MNALTALANRLQVAGVRAVPVEADDESVDDEIEVTSMVSVQVGYGREPYAIVNAWETADKQAMRHWPTRTHSDVDLIVGDVREALKATGREVTAQMLAREFADVICCELTEDEVAEVVAKNATSNECMLQAMASFGMELAPDDQAQTDLMNRAWDIAKAAGFDQTRIG